MADYKYSELLAMQEQAIRRVNEMKRRERAAAQTANRELYGRGKPPQNRPQSGSAGKLTSLPVDYLHGGKTQPQKQNTSGAGNRGGKGEQENMQNNFGRESRAPSGQNSNAQNTQNSGGQSRNPQSREQGTGGQNPQSGRNPGGHASRAQNAVQRREAPRPEQNFGGRNSPERSDSPFSLLDSLKTENDTLLLLGLLYILGKEKADTSLMFALFYILM